MKHSLLGIPLCLLAAVILIAAQSQTAATATPAPVPAAKATRVREADGMVMVYVPAGEFIMGSPDGEGADDEHPQHTVTLGAFWIDRTEVTNAQYRGCLDAGACEKPEYWGDNASNGADQPVVGVAWNDAVAYCEWAGARLPSEAEWEKAARGTDGRTYPWGNRFRGARLNFCDKNCERSWKDSNADDGYARAAPVGSYPGGASPYGALDMLGNVFEWVADWHAGDYYGRSPTDNPPGPDSGDGRVLRGGSWYHARRYARCAYRGWTDPDSRDDHSGFRCSMAASSPVSPTPSGKVIVATATSVPPTPLPAVQTWTRPIDGAAMVGVPAGEFIMGSPEGGGGGRRASTTYGLSGCLLDRPHRGDQCAVRQVPGCGCVRGTALLECQ